MRYLGNAFSLGMMDDLHHPNGMTFVREVRISGETLESAKRWLKEGPWESCVGHADTAALLSRTLGLDVPMRRVTTSLHEDDQILVAQYTGPRLPEGATSLPEGARIRWFLVEL